jgi:hypothetical protein
MMWCNAGQRSSVSHVLDLVTLLASLCMLVWLSETCHGSLDVHHLIIICQLSFEEDASAPCSPGSHMGKAVSCCMTSVAAAILTPI